MRGLAISQQSGQWNSQTGQLDRRTLLHKRYHIQRVIGQGGMGAVYQAKDVKRQTVCAIKEMSLSMVPAHERQQAIQNFKIEAKMLWGLNHPNLPAFTGFFSEGQRYYMVMEYVDGSTLEELLERNGSPFSERRVLGWARQLCDVLEYLHTQNPPIIFRDMKPGNIMLTRNGRIKLIDFGIARFFRSSSSQDTQLLGTPGFAPPEQYGRTQTDERSDIYSLAITLFQMLTNTLSESGFGLKEVRLINPQISISVAHALEKAAALDPGERYSSVSEFRRALLGAGTFVFENGDQATTPEELADLCARYPEEAGDYIADGEIESWLQEIGDTTLARAARHIRALDDEPLAAVEQFLQVVLGPNARLRTYAPSQNQLGARSNHANTMNPDPATARNGGRNWFTRKQTTPILVSPRMLDFGTVYPGISAPMVITISGNQGLMVSGRVQTNEAWLKLDQTEFDGMVTRISVRLDSTDLHDSMHYTGVIFIIPDGEGTQKEVEVMVEADIVGFTLTPPRGRRGKTIGADLDDDDDDDDDDELTMGTMTPFSPMSQTQIAASALTDVDIGLAPKKTPDSEYKIKYGQPGLIGLNGGWNPIKVSPRQQTWLHRALALIASFMSASLIYTLVSQLPQVQHRQPIPPEPWFIAVLVCIAPVATIGASLVNHSTPWSLRDAIDRACTGMASAFTVLVLVRVLWQIVLNSKQPMLQLVALLLVTAIGASLGTTVTISEYINYGMSWAMAKFYWVTIIGITVVGGMLGFLLTLGLASLWGTIIAILVGAGIGSALIWRVDYLMKQNAVNAQNAP
ncbi:MAG: serine/threonine protein kinase [Ktedonobacteraceae bacterium]|nr:serine/threonine protein kinase [Ktedonobacteraceae bacterium]